jgi:hypothetical protein
MAALTADVHIPHKGTPTKLSVKAVGADTFFAGALVYADATSGKAQAVPASGDFFIGICAKQVVAAAADALVDIYVDGLWALAYGSAAEGDQGEAIVIDVVGGTLSDNEADLVTGTAATLAANDILIGKMLAMNYEETSRAWVQLMPGWIYSATLGWV